MIGAIKNIARVNSHVCLLGIMVSIGFSAIAQNTYDSLGVKLPKHYFNSVITLDVYRKPGRKLNNEGTNHLRNRLKSYGINQAYISFYTPLLTKIIKKRDSLIRGNIHLLLTGNFLSLRPIFNGNMNHTLIQAGAGLRLIYNTGKKGVWFLEASPFVTSDVTYASKPYFRMASTLVYSHNANSWFNWRLGITKSFLWGNRFYLPFVGLRIGRLDKVNLSIQFPRSASINVPVTSWLICSIYTRPQGGVYNFSNRDSLYFKRSESTFHFARYEINTGLRLDVRALPQFNFYLAAGISTKNNVSFYSESANQNSTGAYNVYFFSGDVPPSLFFQFGFVFKFGKTRSYFNDKNIYDAIDLNNTFDMTGNTQIPLPKKRAKDLNLESVKDLVDFNDF